MKMCVVSQVEQINRFWTGDPNAFKRLNKLWYRRSTATDDTIRRAFGNALQAAEAGELDDWQTTPAGSLALIILFDQFSRNLYRGSAMAYHNDARAQEIALELVSRQGHTGLSIAQQIMVLHPFHHAEDEKLQDMAVNLMEALTKQCESTWRAVLQEKLKFMNNHRKIVQKFGRFPHRNATLGRESTPDEILYLSKDKRRYGQY